MGLVKIKPWVCQQLRDSAERVDECCGQGPTCNGGQGDICVRHSNEDRHGKGKGIKAHDIFFFYGCQPCEDYYSGPTMSRVMKHAFFLEAWERSILKAIEVKGLPTGPKG